MNQLKYYIHKWENMSSSLKTQNWPLTDQKMRFWALNTFYIHIGLEYYINGRTQSIVHWMLLLHKFPLIPNEGNTHNQNMHVLLSLG